MTTSTKLDGIMLANSFGKIGGREVATSRLWPSRSGEMLHTPFRKVNQQDAKPDHIPSRSSFGRPLNITETPGPRPLIRFETSDINTAKDPLQSLGSHLSG
jgi:hypothetical protein